jgi:hypothetical protein
MTTLEYLTSWKGQVKVINIFNSTLCGKCIEKAKRKNKKIVNCNNCKEHKKHWKDTPSVLKIIV